ncbi:hypothetical protein E2N92_07745 [Methanofollis formosanus]|uniref:Uncharacterized protein n=1 Tax=Methanofollis formosanus TaxID=299308 RepID=A0A8G1A1J9_9EURY|nr:hypothetical protein [Methanofollis formosanus]QYZ79326.1 hypothetical protein E2N92_07745 [Methanofollis formosanus]
MNDLTIGEAVVAGDRAVVPLMRETELAGMGGVLFSGRPVALIVAEIGSTVLFRLDTDVPLAEGMVRQATERAFAALKKN